MGQSKEVSGAPIDGDGAYKTKQYRDLFAEKGHPQAESHAKIERAFRQLFHGDGQEERVYFELARMKTVRWPTSPTGQTTTRAPKA